MSDFFAFIAWWLLVCFSGWVVWPLLFRMMPGLPERGYALSKACGLLLIGYVLWMLGSLGYLRLTSGGVLISVTVVALLSLRFGSPSDSVKWLVRHRRLALLMECVFFVFFAVFAYLRALNPEIVGTEKPMEFAFLNSILREGVIPPADPWLSGYSISYYYFGYVIVGMLTRASGVLPGVGFNLGVAVMFALAAVGSFGVLLNLIALSMKAGKREEILGGAGLSRLALPAVLGPVYTVMTGNLGGLLEVFHQRGLGGLRFWEWIGIESLDALPALSGGWMPQRYMWWWQASRVIGDYDLGGNAAAIQPIDEFPFFSFLLGDLHPHVLALPFVLLAVGFALEMFTMSDLNAGRASGWYTLPAAKFILIAVVLGGLAFLNTWDFPILWGILIAAYSLGRKKFGRTELWLALTLVIVAGMCYLPFYLGFSSQAAGILPNPVYDTKINQFAVLFGVLLVPALAWIISEFVGRRDNRNWRLGILVGPGILLVLVVSCLLLTTIMLSNPEIRGMYREFDALDGKSVTEDILIVLRHRMSDEPWTAILLTSVMFFCGSTTHSKADLGRTGVSVTPFVALLLVVGAFLTLVPEFIYLHDGFNARMNTVFKFYYQAWSLWGLVAAYGLWRLNECCGRRIKLMLWPLVTFTLASGLLYTGLATWTKTEGLKGTTVVEGKRVAKLDGMASMTQSNAEEYAALMWLNKFLDEDGVIAEAIGGSYSEYGRVSTHSGLPTLLGWPGHEVQWRGGFEEAAGREEAIKRLYSVRSWDEAFRIMRQYGIVYVYVGDLERRDFPNEGLAKFVNNMNVIYSNARVSIYERIDN